MDNSPNFYRWNRISKPRTYSRSQKITTDDDVQDWIKKVEDASNMAAAATFGKTSSASRHVEDKVARLRDNDAAFSEAQELLNQWVSEKLHLENDVDDFEETWTHTPSAALVKKEWDHLLAQEEEETFGVLKHKANAAVAYTMAESEDEEDIVDQILQGMLDKKVVDLSVNKEEDEDPRIKMHLRHQQVKENRENRTRKLENEKRERIAKKEAQFRAKKMLLEEERQKAQHVRQEELYIQQEMARIRKEMQEEQKRRAEVKLQKKLSVEKCDKLVREAIETQNKELEDTEREKEQQMMKKRQQLMIRLGEIERKRVSDNLKSLHRHFSAWYEVVIQRRIQMGKCRAMCDWKLLFRAWNCWRVYVRGCRLQREALQHERNVKVEQKKLQTALQHHKRTLLRRCFTSWQLWVREEQQRTERDKVQAETKLKMMSFLEAAASGKLWDTSIESSSNLTDRSQSSVQTDGSTQRKVDEMFSQPTNARNCSNSARSDQSIASGKQGRSNVVSKPNEPWQITRKHLKLTKEQISSMGQSGCNDGSGDHAANQSETTTHSHSEQQIQKRFSNSPWLKTGQVVNNFEHRHQAQQKILQDQQSQLKEQQQLIAELQFMQKQNLLQQQLTQQQLIHQQLNNTSTVPGQQGPLKNLQINVIAKDKDTNIQQSEARIENNGLLSSPKAGRETERRDNSSENNTSYSNMISSRSTSTATCSSKLNSKHANFLKAMEERAAERARKKEERENVRRKQEEEKLVRLEAEEMKRIQEEEENKRARMEAYKEKKRMEREKELEKQRWQEKLKGLQKRAEEHYQHSLIKYQGWRPWRSLVKQAITNRERADHHYYITLLRKYFSMWISSVRDTIARNQQMADQMREYLLVRRCFCRWKRFGECMTIEQEKADRHYRRQLLRKLINNWADFAVTEKMDMWKKERVSKEHNIFRLKKRTFQAWKKLPLLTKEEIEKEKRREEMRKKVASLLPDFQGFAASGSP